MLTKLPRQLPDARRYALVDKVEKQNRAHEYRFRRDGKGFVTEEYNPLKEPTEQKPGFLKPPE